LRTAGKPNKEFHTSIIVSEATRSRLGDERKCAALGGVKVKGKTVETTVYELQAGCKSSASGGNKFRSRTKFGQFEVTEVAV